MTVGYRHLYLHVPFCARRCSYCDFSIAVGRVVPWRAFADSVDEELALRHARMECAPLDTLYLGGGTPSRLGAEGVAALFEVLKRHVEWTPNAEVTLEANPEDITPDAVAAWRAAGVNRLSIGVQSFDDAVLTWMHRVHDAKAAARAVSVARNGGLEAFSLDLIFAVPEHLKRDWDRDLDQALALAPDHISLYGLTVEPHTPLGRWHARGEVTEAPEDRYEQEFLAANQRLRGAGYEHYEVSNFAQPGKRARHNSAYWRGVPYLGVGPSAHGFDGVTRRWNVEAHAAWRTELKAGRDPRGGDEVLTGENRAAESVYLGLRTRDGLRLESSMAVEKIRPWVEEGWVEWCASEGESVSEKRIRCTPMGWLRLDAMAADLTAIRSH